MAGKKKGKKARRTAIVPRSVFAAAVALGSVPMVAGCGDDDRPSVDAGFFGVAALDATFSVAVDAAIRDAGTDGAMFSVAAIRDAGTDGATFSVAIPVDSGTFSVAALPDSGTFSVAAPAPDGSA